MPASAQTTALDDDFAGLRQPLAALLDACARAGFSVHCHAGDGPLRAHAAFHQRGEGYILTKRATLWAAESHEHLFVYVLPHLDMSRWRAIHEDGLRRGREQIRPHDEHMVSYVSLLVFCRTLDAEAAHAVRRTRYSKSFWWGLRGWMRLRACVVAVPERAGEGGAPGPGKLVSNAAARKTLAPFIRASLHECFTLTEWKV